MDNVLEMVTRRYEGIIIYYVDDEWDNLNSAAINLEEEFSIETEQDSEKALKEIQSGKPIHVLIVDQVMPKVTGMQLAEAMKKKNPLVPCIMITGFATKDLAIEAIRGRLLYDLLEKPVDFSTNEAKRLLIGAIQEYLLRSLRAEYEAGTVDLLARVIDERDGYTHQHSQRVKELSCKTARKFDLPEKDIVRIAQAALLHDVGKIGIPDAILKKEGKLTLTEKDIMQSHPERGARLVEQIDQLKDIADIIRYHHEAPNGNGYPHRLKGKDIPLPAAIVHVCDFFDALQSDRPYKKGWPVIEIVKEIHSLRGEEFDSEVVDAFFAVLLEDGLISENELSKSIKEAEVEGKHDDSYGRIEEKKERAVN